DVFNVLLQILDDGRLTDSQGRTVDFKNTLIVMTSNIGSQFITDLAATEDDTMRHRVTEALRGHFRPEFLNRIDEVVIFKQLTRAELRHIVDLQLNRVRARLEERHITLDVTPEAMDLLGNEGFDPVYGARPLKRVIQRHLLDRLALELIDGSVKDGDTVVADAKEGGIVFSVRHIAQVPAQASQAQEVGQA
ncbi:MAG: AAA family ATPase, partial [Chloroflexi bacterium]|nr:AAA family ATPase [Chloroflexota bacterium]